MGRGTMGKKSRTAEEAMGRGAKEPIGWRTQNHKSTAAEDPLGRRGPKDQSRRETKNQCGRVAGSAPEVCEGRRTERAEKRPRKY